MWSQNLCRTCGQISETCHPIYDLDPSGGIEEKIKSVLKLEIDIEDKKPKQICNNCLMKLNDILGFLNLVQVTNLKFDSIYSSSLKKSSNLWSNTTLAELKQEKIEDNNTEYNASTYLENMSKCLMQENQDCLEYEQNFKPEKISKSVPNKIDEYNSDITLQSVCNSLSFSALNIHSKEPYFYNNNKEKCISVDRRKIKKNNLYTCSLCGKKFDSKRKFLNHEENHVKKILGKKVLMKKNVHLKKSKNK